MNDGTSQRSRVSGVTVLFDQPVALDSGAITFAGRNGAVAATTMSYENPLLDGRTWVLSFTGGDIVGGSLADGVYDLSVIASKVHAGTPTGSAMTGNAAPGFDCLFGDYDGNKTVNTADYGRFRQTFGLATGAANFNPLFDYDGNGTINTSDYGRFRTRFGTSLLYSIISGGSTIPFHRLRGENAASPSAEVAACPASFVRDHSAFCRSASPVTPARAADDGIFDTSSDVGTVLHPGSAEFDPAKKTYTVAGSGENMWAAKDAFQFAWKKADRRPDADGRHLVPRRGDRPAPQGVPDDPPEPGRRLGLRRRGAARRRADVAAVPRRQGRGHARGAGERESARSGCGWRSGASTP